MQLGLRSSAFNTTLSGASNASSAQGMFAFVHMPKTAGTSVRRAMEAKSAEGAVLALERNENIFFLNDAQWRGVTIATGHFALPLIKMFGATRWGTCLRHPIDRCVSQVQHWLRVEPSEPELDRFGFTLPPLDRNRGVTWNMEMILARGDGERFCEISNTMTYQLVDDIYFRSLPADQRTLRFAEDALEAATCLAVTEDINGLAKGLSATLGVTLTLGHENTSQSSSRDISAALPGALKRRLEEANALDIALYEKALSLVGKRGWYGMPSNQFDDCAPQAVYDPRRSRTIDRTFMLDNELRECDVSMRAAHAVLDIAQFTNGLALKGDVHVFGRMKATDLAVLQASLGPGEELIEHLAGCDSNHSSNTPRAEAKMRSAWIQTRSERLSLLSSVNAVVQELGDRGYAMLLNALTGNGFESVTELCHVLATDGLQPLAAIDQHLLFCKAGMRCALAALLKAKFNNCIVERIVIYELNCLQIASDY